MARQQRTTQGPAGVGPFLVGIAFVASSGNLLGKAAGILCHLSCVLIGLALRALPGIFLAALQALESYALDHGGVLAGAQMLTWAGSLVHFLVAP